MKKRSIISTIPEVFSLNAKSDYSRFVVREGANGMMRDRWIAIGNRLNASAQKVGKEANGQAQKTEAA